jgi:hypothetical protein
MFFPTRRLRHMSPDPSMRLTKLSELLHRQVHPNFLSPDGRPSRQAFEPTKKDEGYLSVSRSSRASAEVAFRRHTEQKGLKSAGVWSVTVEECGSVGSAAFEDCLPDDDAHALIDISGLSNSQVRQRADRLADFARRRGRLHPPP